MDGNALRPADGGTVSRAVEERIFLAVPSEEVDCLPVKCLQRHNGGESLAGYSDVR